MLLSTLLPKMIPLYVLVLLGFIAGKRLKVQQDSIAKLAIYITAPIIVFHGGLRAPLDQSSLWLPFLFFSLPILLSFFWYRIGTRIWKDATANIFAYGASTGNTGYFGIPLTLALFGESSLSTVVLAILGLILYENTYGFFLIARGHHTIRESLMKVLCLPSLWAFVLGLTCNIFALPTNDVYESFITMFRGTYSVLGMMLVGIGIASSEKFVVDWKFLSLSTFAKFVVWPLLAIIILHIDSSYLHIFSFEARRTIFLLSTVPMAANTVAFATELKAAPAKTALAVLVSTLLALVVTPLLVSSYFNT